MKSTSAILLLTLTSILLLNSGVKATDTGLPLIGIIAIPASHTLNNEYYDASTYWSYMPTSYSQYISQTGAMPLLIPFDLPIETLDHLLKKIQGVHFIGGGAPLFDAAGEPTFWQQRVTYIMKAAEKINDAGTYFPIVATCFGMQSLTTAMAGNNNSLLGCDYADLDTNHTVNPTSDFSKSKIWNLLDEDLVNKGFSNGYLYYSHNCAFDPSDLTSNPEFNKNAMVTATSIALNGKEFVAMVEHRKYPFFANQWHPEKTQYERIGPTWLSRDADTVRFTSEFIMTVVDQVRENAHELANIDGATRAFFEVYHIPERPAWEDFEQIYTFQQYSAASRTTSSAHKYENADQIAAAKKIKNLLSILGRDIEAQAENIHLSNE